MTDIYTPDETDPTLAQQWAQPSPVTDVDLAFPARGGELTPAYDEDEERRLHPKWVEFQRKWFYEGLTSNMGLIPKDGIDPNLAFRHLRVVQGTYATKHQHKEFGVAYLASLWFEDIIWDIEMAKKNGYIDSENEIPVDLAE